MLTNCFRVSVGALTEQRWLPGKGDTFCDLAFFGPKASYFAFADSYRLWTRLTWRMRFDSAEHCEQVKPFVTEANEQNLDRLEAELARMT